MNAPAIYFWSYADEVTPARLSAWQQCLGPSEQARLGSMTHAGRRAEYICGHWLLRQALKHRYSHLSVHEYIHDPSEGAPFIRAGWDTDVHFSLSHSGGVAACVLAQGQSVGLDIQQLDTEVRVQALADRYFSANEARTLSGMPDADKKTAFFTHWVLKESLAKQQGRGLMHGALRTGFIPQPDSEAACHWFFRWEGLFCAVSFEAGIAWSRMDCHVLEQQKMRRVVWDVEQQDGVKASHCVAQSFDKFLAT